MPSFKLAHLHQQGQDMLLFPLNDNFGHKTQEDQHDTLAELEAHAHGAGLAGSAVVVWRSSGRTNFIGPRPWHAYLRSIDMNFVLRNVNREISW